MIAINWRVESRHSFLLFYLATLLGKSHRFTANGSTYHQKPRFGTDSPLICIGSCRTVSPTLNLSILVLFRTRPPPLNFQTLPTPCNLRHCAAMAHRHHCLSARSIFVHTAVPFLHVQVLDPTLRTEYAPINHLVHDSAGWSGFTEASKLQRNLNIHIS